MGLEEAQARLRGQNIAAPVTGGLEAAQNQLRGQVTSAPMARGNSVAGYQDPGGLAPAQSLEELGNNMAVDAGDSLQGLFALGSNAALRIAQSWIPKGVYEPQKFSQDFGDAMLPYKIIRPGDAEAVQAFGQGVLDHYDKNVVGPVARAAGYASTGDFNPAGQELNTVADYWKTRPISATFDFMPVGEAAVGQAAKVAKPFMPAIAKAAKSAPVVGDVVALQGYAKEGKEVTRNADYWYRNRLGDQFKQMEEAYNKVPDTINEHLTEGGEVRNAASEAIVRSNPEASAYLDLKDKFNQLNGKLYKDIGAMSPLEEQMAKWGPAVIDRARKLGIPLEYPDLLHPSLQPTVQTVRQILESEGHKPVYSGMVKKVEVEPATQRAKSLFEGPTMATRKAAAEVADMDPQAVKQAISDRKDLPSGFRARTVGERIPDLHETDDLKSWQTRTIQGLQFVGYIKYLEEMMDLSKKIIAEKPHLANNAIPLQDFMSQFARASHMDPESALHFVNGLGTNKLLLPEGLAKEFVKMTKPPPKLQVPLPGGHSIDFSKLNALFKTFTLGLDAMWAVNQGMQSGMAANAAMWRGPKSTAATLMAYAMAFDKKITSKLPASFFTDIAGMESGVSSTAFLEKYGKLGAVTQGYMNKVFGMTTAAENYWRTVLGLQRLMEAEKQMSGAAKVAWHEAMDIMARQQQVFTNISDPKIVLRASVEVDKWMGKYSALAAKEAGLWRELLPFTLWYQHALSMYKALVFDTPFKNQALNRLEQLAPHILQEPDAGIMTDRELERGAVVVKDGENQPILGVNGKYMTSTNGGFTPFSQTPQLLQGVVNVATNNGEPVEGLMYSPLLQYFDGQRGINTNSGRAFTNPHALSMAGQKFQNQDDPERIERQGVPIENLLLQPVFPRIAGTLKSINSGKYKPTDQTSLLPFGDAAIQRTREFPDGVEQMEPWQRFIFGFAKLNLSEQTYDRESQDNMNQREAKRFRQTQRQQGWRTPKDASVLQRLSGYISNEEE